MLYRDFVQAVALQTNSMLPVCVFEIQSPVTWFYLGMGVHEINYRQYC